mmetsp:Transcript_47552/g.112129  ORF Transcript_47552/g.112129 Transcript_47552/m.112129 type:complete len:240 (-) Transcript_47552:76-795(-)
MQPCFPQVMHDFLREAHAWPNLLPPVPDQRLREAPLRRGPSAVGGSVCSEAAGCVARAHREEGVPASPRHGGAVGPSEAERLFRAAGGEVHVGAGGQAGPRARRRHRRALCGSRPRARAQQRGLRRCRWGRGGFTRFPEPGSCCRCPARGGSRVCGSGGGGGRGVGGCGAQNIGARRARLRHLPWRPRRTGTAEGSYVVLAHFSRAVPCEFRTLLWGHVHWTLQMSMLPVPLRQAHLLR